MTFDSARTRHRDLRGHQSTRSATRLHTIGPRLGASQDGRDGPCRRDILQTPVLEGLPLASRSRCEQELSRYMAIWHECHVLSRTAALITRMNQQSYNAKKCKHALARAPRSADLSERHQRRERGTPKRDACADPRLAAPPTRRKHASSRASPLCDLPYAMLPHVTPTASARTLRRAARTDSAEPPTLHAFW